MFFFLLILVKFLDMFETRTPPQCNWYTRLVTFNNENMFHFEVEKKRLSSFLWHVWFITTLKYLSFSLSFDKLFFFNIIGLWSRFLTLLFLKSFIFGSFGFLVLFICGSFKSSFLPSWLHCDQQLYVLLSRVLRF